MILQGRPFSFVHYNHKLNPAFNNRRPILLSSANPACWLVDTLKRGGMFIDLPLRSLMASKVDTRKKDDLAGSFVYALLVPFRYRRATLTQRYSTSG